MSGIRSTGMRVLTPVYQRAGSAYLSGPERATAIAVADRLVAGGTGVTLGFWPLKGEPASSVTAEHQACVEALRGHGGEVTIAVKAPALGFDLEVVQRLGRQAAETDLRLLFDSHSPDAADRTLALAGAAQAEGARVGVALPSRWSRSLQDAETAAGAGLSVRLVKGQWPDDAGRGPVGEAGLRSSFLRLLDRAIACRVAVSVATHDVALLERALDRLAAAGVRPDVEMLLGLPVRRGLSVAARRGARVAFYVPYGHPGLPYPFSAVLRRPRLTAMLAQGIALGARNQRIQQRAALR